MLLPHGKQILGVHAARVSGHIQSHEGHRRTGRRIPCRVLHRLSLRSGNRRRGHRRVAQRRVALKLLYHLLVFFAGAHAGDAEGDYLYTAMFAPFCAQHAVERVRKLHRVSGQRAVTNAHLRYFGKGRLERRQQLALELAVYLAAGVAYLNVAAHVLIEQHRVADVIAVFSEAAYCDIHIQTDAVVDHAERNGICCAVFVAHQLFGVEIVYALVLGGVAAEGKALAERFERLLQAVSEAAREERRLSRGVIYKFARLRAVFDDPALFDDHHKLSVRNCDDRAVGDDVVACLGVRRTRRGAFLSLYSYDVGRQRIAVKILLPLVGEHSACCTQCCLNKSQSDSPCIFSGGAAFVCRRDADFV